MNTKKITVAIILGIFCFVNSMVFAQGTSLPLTPNHPYEQTVQLAPASRYRIGMNVRSNVANAIISISIKMYDAGGEQIAISQVQRGLGDPGRWYTIGIEFDTPTNISTAKLHITTGDAGEYWWDALEITQLDLSQSAIRKFWEDKLAVYGQVFTGLVVDARGLNVGRGMNPRVWSESGQLIYGGINASYDYLQQVGLVSYGHELTPELLQRIAVDPAYPLAVPLVVKAVGVVEPTRTSVIISDEAAEQILKALAAYDFLARFAVIFLID